MAGNLSNQGEHFVLNFLFRGTGAALDNVYLGLATSPLGDSDTLATVDEVSDENYQRQPISFGPPEQTGGKGTVVIDQELSFPAWEEDQPDPITHAFIAETASGTTGMLLAWFQLVDAEEPLAGQVVVVREGDLIFDID